MNNKGYTMLELLVCILIISLISLLSIHNSKNLDTSHLHYMNEYLHKQSESMKEAKQNVLDNGLYFNSMGRINSARTIKSGKHNIIIHLGNGYITYE